MIFVIAVVAIALVGIRPRGIPAWAWPIGGAALVVALGDEPAAAGAAAVAQQWNVLLFILGLMLLSAAAEESGAFAWIADVLLERAGGSRRRLFTLLFLAGAVMTCVLSNDATAIVFTPIVYRAVAKRGDALPFLFGCTFVADTASFGLPFANPANILVLPRPQILDYLWHLGPPQLAAIAINLVLFLAIFHGELRGRYTVVRAKTPHPHAIRALIAMCLVAAAYLVALAFQVPIGPVAVAGALATLAVARVAPLPAARRVGWSTFLLLAGLFVLLDAIDRGGFVAWAFHALDDMTRHGTLALVSVAAISAALLSNLMNNLPVAIASSYVVAHAPSQHLAYPLIVGIDLGPNLTTSGSLATILWLTILRERGVHVTALQYARLGAIVVPPTIAVCVLWLWIIGLRVP